MAANASAAAAGAKTVRFSDHGANFETPVNPYRAWCFDELQRSYGELSPESRKTIDSTLAAAAVRILQSPRQKTAFSAPALPIKSREQSTPRDREWR
jgi:hypothetical protein